MATTEVLANVPGHDDVCSCTRCILARMDIRERRDGDRRATPRDTPDRRS